MAKTEYKFLVGSVISGVLGFVFLVASLCTENWVSADVAIISNGNNVALGGVNHGLFTGRFDRQNVGTKYTYYLTVTCLISDNVCMWSCLDDADARSKELELLYNTGQASFECIAVSDKFFATKGTDQKIDPDSFLQAGLWISTIFFLILAMFFNVVAVGFNVYNIFYNPIHSFTGITGLYIYYSTAACSTIMAIILWGAEFGAYTSNNIAILDTLVSQGLEVEATLDFSYFFMSIAIIEQSFSIGMIYYRQYRINKAQEETVVRVDDKTNDASTFMY